MLRVAPCTYRAAKYAVEHWHYSERMPAGKLLHLGVWEFDRFIGAVVFGRGANNSLGKPYGLSQIEACELVRVALTEHEATVSQIVAHSLDLLKRTSPGFRLVVSFADPEEGHHGGIYQAGNWLYVGMSHSADEYIVRGQRMHGRSLRAMRKAKGGTSLSSMEFAQAIDANARRVKGSSKFRYLMPLDKAMRRKLKPLALPYPSAEEVSKARHQPAGLEGQVRSLHSAPFDR